MSLPADTILCDTLVYDTAEISAWQSDPAYDYNRELITPDADIWALFNFWFGKLMQKIFGSHFAEQYSEIILVVLFIILLLVVLWFLYKKRPELFKISRKNNLAYTVQEDTIYGIDFDKEIDSALQQKDYREAIRMLYLQTLKVLSDTGQLNWQPYKTPTEYIYEVKGEEQKVPFRDFTNRFLRVRYGNFDATEPVFREMKHLQEQMSGTLRIGMNLAQMKGGDYER